MSITWYDGHVPMTPEMEKRQLCSGDDDFTCKVPKVVYRCGGEKKPDHKAFEWNTNSVIIADGKRAVEYVEDMCYEILLPDLEGRTSWESGPIADIMGWDIARAKDTRKIEKRYINEYDFDKFEKRRYRLVLEKVSSIDEYERCSLEDVLGEDAFNSDGYTMELSEFL